MSRIVAITFASLLALGAAPAAAQYGGSPDQQVDAPPGYAGPAAQAGPRGYAGKGDDQAMAADPGAYDKDQDGDQADAGDQANDQAADANDQAADANDQVADANDQAEGPPPPEADDGYGPDERDAPRACRRSDGTTGAIVGGGAGALVGHGIDRHGERGTGTILGAVIGALVGHAVEQGSCR